VRSLAIDPLPEKTYSHRRLIKILEHIDNQGVHGELVSYVNTVVFFATPFNVGITPR